MRPESGLYFQKVAHLYLRLSRHLKYIGCNNIDSPPPHNILALPLYSDHVATETFFHLYRVSTKSETILLKLQFLINGLLFYI